MTGFKSYKCDIINKFKKILRKKLANKASLFIKCHTCNAACGDVGG